MMARALQWNTSVERRVPTDLTSAVTTVVAFVIRHRAVATLRLNGTVHE